MPELSYDQRISLANNWLHEHLGELIPCQAMPGRQIREKVCQARQERYPKWIRREHSGKRYKARLHPKFMFCKGCPRFDPGEPPTQGVKPDKPKPWIGCMQKGEART